MWKEIKPNEYYYIEYINRFLQRLNAKKYCSDCYDKHGLELLRIDKNESNKQTQKTLEEF
jgi:hypothetical protein